jgi:reductive dehalogenase
MVIPNSVQHAIVTAYAMNRTLIQAAPGMLDMVATSIGYSRMSFGSLTLVNYIRAQGYIAIPCSNGVGATVPMATEAGLGQAGRAGFLITPEFGPSVRLDKILTNMPLVPDEPIDLGVNEFCLHCKKCARECPSKAITTADRAWEGQTDYSVKGVYKWYNDPEKCLSFWMESGNDCAVCIAACPYTKGDLWAHKITEWSIKHIPVADGIWLTLDDDLHYGARRDSAEVMRDLNMSPYGLEADTFGKGKI